MIPLVLLAGFLGAGKTRFLTDVIPMLYQRGVRVRVVLNDFENADIDASRLASLNALVTPLNGECVCCVSLRDLMETLYAVPDDPNTVMLIEANGATETDELIGFLTMDSKLAQYTPPLQLTVLDAGRWQKRWFHNALERAQATTATHLYLNWAHKLSAERLVRVTSTVQVVNPRAELTTPTRFADELAALVRSVAGEADRKVLQAHSGSRHSDGQHHRAGRETGHIHTGISHEHPFASTSMPLPDYVVRASFNRFVDGLPESVVRAKGQVRFADKPDKMYVWNKVEGRGGVKLDECTPHAHTRPVALFVGVRLPLEELAEQIGRIESAPGAIGKSQ